MCVSCWVVSDSLWPRGLCLPGSAVPGILHARILEWFFHFFLQGIFPTQWLNSGLLHCRQILYNLNNQGSMVEGKKGVLSQNNIPCIPTNPHCGVDGLLWFLDGWAQVSSGQWGQCGIFSVLLALSIPPWPLFGAVVKFWLHCPPPGF